MCCFGVWQGLIIKFWPYVNNYYPHSLCIFYTSLPFSRELHQSSTMGDGRGRSTNLSFHTFVSKLVSQRCGVSKRNKTELPFDIKKLAAISCVAENEQMDIAVGYISKQSLWHSVWSNSLFKRLNFSKMCIYKGSRENWLSLRVALVLLYEISH